MTTGQLRAALVGQIMDYDPAAVIRRRKQAEKDARVETWTEAAGTGAVAGRDLPPADVLAADKTLAADARWLKAHGADGTMDQLRAKAFTARLTGQPLDSLLPAPGTTPARQRPSRARCGPPAARTGPAQLDRHAGAGRPAPITRTHRAAGQRRWPAGSGGSVNLTMPAAVLARPERHPRADQRPGRGRRRDLPRRRRHPRPPARRPVVHHPPRARRAARRPRVRPRRTRTTRHRPRRPGSRR